MHHTWGGTRITQKIHPPCISVKQYINGPGKRLILVNILESLTHRGKSKHCFSSFNSLNIIDCIFHVRQEHWGYSREQVPTLRKLKILS